MPDFELSLAPRQLTQAINPWSWTMGNVSLFSINLGYSAAPDVEQRVLNEVGSYGRQLGRMGDALQAIIAWAEGQGMPPHPAIDDLKVQLGHVEGIKQAEAEKTARAS